MDRLRVAEELVKMARDLVGASKGTFEDNGKKPKVGEKVWIWGWTPGKGLHSGVVESVSQSDRLSSGRVFLEDGSSAPLNMTYDHKPKKVTKEDEMGKYTEWE